MKPDLFALNYPKLGEYNCLQEFASSYQFTAETTISELLQGLYEKDIQEQHVLIYFLVSLAILSVACCVCVHLAPTFNRYENDNAMCCAPAN